MIAPEQETAPDETPQLTTPKIPGQQSEPAPLEPAWLTLSNGSTQVRSDPPLRSRRVYAQVIAMTALVVLAVAILGAIASRQVAEREAVHDAAQQAAFFADIVVQPALTDGIFTGQPAALAKIDAAVRDHILGEGIVRVKFWTAEGRIVYSDEPRLINEVFPLGDEQLTVMRKPATRAEVTNLGEPENRFEKGQGKLLEVYRPVWTPSGQTLLFETYAPYSSVLARSSDIWRGFAGITISSLLILILLLLPVLWRLLDRLKRSQVQREALLERAVEASAEERRRIAATLHDGVVQELAAASFVVSGAALRAESEGESRLADALRKAAGTVRTSIGGLRSLLVDIYPPSLEATGLTAALGDLVGSLRTRDIDVRLDVPNVDAKSLDEEGERLVFRVAQECLRNAARHAGATRVDVALTSEDDSMVLDVVDNGIGFDARQVLEHPKEGHFGLRLMIDATAKVNGLLRVASGPGQGTHWQLRVPTS